MSITDKLARLLYIVPYVEHRDGVLLTEIAEKCGVSTAQIEKDILLLSMVGQPPLTPDHLIDMVVEDGVVYVDLHQNLSRPLRLTHDEARALVLAVKMVGDLGGMGETLMALVEQISSHLNPVDREIIKNLSQSIDVSTASGQSELRWSDLIEENREAGFEYYSVSSDRLKDYRVRPIALLNHSGHEYLLAQDQGAELKEKLFRTDRMRALKRFDAIFEPIDVDLERFRKEQIVQLKDGGEASVYFAPSLTQHIKERFGSHALRFIDDGGVMAQLPAGSAAWIMRWVLPFGTLAEVMQPESLRQQLGEKCRRAAALYN